MYRHKRFSYLSGSLAIAILAVAAFLVLMGGSQTKAAPPSRPLAYTEITADTVWGPGVVTVTEDVVIKNGATLVITPGTTVLIFTDTTPYLGGVSDLIEIIVEDGRLVADGFITDTQIITPFQTITFTSAFDGDPPWWGIRILDGDAGESVINYALIEYGAWGIYVENSSPTVTHSIIRSMRGDVGAGGDDGTAGVDGAPGTSSTSGGDGSSGGDGAPGGGEGQPAYGIYISGTASAPLITSNEIYNIYGGSGGSGGDGGKGGGGGAGYSPGVGSGGDGGEGASGGMGGVGADGADAAGIYVDSATPTIVSNEIYGIGGGPGGYGGDGGDGGDGGGGGNGSTDFIGLMYGGNAGNAGNGGDGGNATSQSGRASGIYVTGNSAPEVRDNEIYAITGAWMAGRGGDGGNGGIGGPGGNGSGFAGAVGPSGTSGNGGDGGAGGSGSSGGEADGIHTTNETQAQVVDNLVWYVMGGGGGAGGRPGKGGAGGQGGIGGNGGDGGTGGTGGVGGDGGDGALGVCLHPSATPDFLRNTVFSCHGGSGGDGGRHSSTVTGGAGGDGGDSANLNGSNGGWGGDGGKGASNGNGGNGGEGVGILSDAASDVINNVIYGVYGGNGGAGGSSFHLAAGQGGDGGDGGNGIFPGSGGNGGDGGGGGDGKHGGNAGDGVGIHTDTGAPRIANNTIDRLKRGYVGKAGEAGSGGSGGAAGEVGGNPGLLGASGSGGLIGAEAKTVGLYFTNDAAGDVYNNIVARTVYTTNQYFVGTYSNSFGIKAETTILLGVAAVANLDYNDVWNWETNYAGVTPGANDISADPLFVDVFCMDCEDYRLLAGSPCIDTASNDQAPADDKDRVLRPQDGDLDGVYVADMGAYEHITGTTTITITPGAGDVITTPDGLVEIEWPVGAITCSTVMTYTPLGAPGQALPGALVFGGIAFDLQATDCNGDPLTDFLKPLDLTVHYAEHLLPLGMNEETLAIHKWDGTAEQWVKLAVIGRNTGANFVTVRLERLCEFDLLGTVMKYKVYLPLVLRNYAP